jgi:tRNA-guanine family transglycosylase
MRLEIHAKPTGSQAPVATLATWHASVETRVFMPAGARATVRSQTRAQLEQLGAPILLANTYHLLVRPGRRDAHAHPCRRVRRVLPEQRELLARSDPDHPPGPRLRVKRRKPQVQR